MFDSHGIWVARGSAELNRLARLVAAGRAVKLAPRVYATPDAAACVAGRVHAALAWCPDAVVVGPAAASFTFWSDCPVRTIDLVHPVRSHGPEWITLHRRSIDPIWVQSSGRLRWAHPALVAAIMAGGEHGGDAVDHALNAGVRLQDIAAAPSRGWPGGAQRRQVLAASRDEPWSPAERKAHRLLHRARITGWSANRRVPIRSGHCRPDIVFGKARLVIEIDGFAVHGTRAAFEADRRRQNELELAGWRVLRFTVAMLDEPGLFIGTVRAALAA